MRACYASVTTFLFEPDELKRLMLEKLARDTGFALKAITDICEGRDWFDPETAEILAKALGISRDELAEPAFAKCPFIPPQSYDAV
jgi:hypothetical protein